MQWKKLTTCNYTAEYERIDEKPLFHNVQFHQLGLYVSAATALIAVVMSLYLIWRHATHYLKPWEQRQIIRILFMVPIYSVVSFLSYRFYRHAVYFAVLRDCYEAFAIASFFTLLCHYIAPDLHTQKDYFRTLRPRPWMIPLSWFKKCCGGERGAWRTPRSGLTWFNIIWVGVFQYCFVRIFMTFVALITEATGRYCLDSLSPFFAHVWVMVIEGFCVSIAMYCLLQFYVQLRDDLSEHKPGLKIVAIKLVIFLSFWQTILVSFMTSSGFIKATPQIAMPDVKVGIPSLCLCIEMSIFSVLHLWAFPWKVYDINRSEIVAAEGGPGLQQSAKEAYSGGFMGLYACMDAFNPWDLVKAVGRGARWITVGRKHRETDISYKNSAQGTGLEPTRTGGPYGGPGGMNLAFGGGKPGEYQPVDDDDDERLLEHAQSNPFSRLPNQYSKSTLNTQQTSEDIGTTGASQRYDGGTDHLGTMHPTPGTIRRNEQGQQLGVVDSHLGEDTGYHGRQNYPPPASLQPGRLGHSPWDAPPGERGFNPPHDPNMF